MKRKRHELTKEKYLLDHEVQHLESILERFKNSDPRNCTLIWTALHTGARAQEILNLRTADLYPDENVVLIRGLKDSKDREIPLPAWLFKRLQKEAPCSGRIFTISYSRFFKIWCEYRPCRKKLHATRHTFAIKLYRKTKDIRLVQMALGHRSLASTLIYSDYQFGKDELRKALLG